MSTGIDTRKVIASEICYDCGENNLIIYHNGSYHCGACSQGGTLLAYEPVEERFKYQNLLKRKDIMDKIENSHIHGGAFVMGHAQEALDLFNAFKELRKISPKKAGFVLDNSDTNTNLFGIKLWSCKGKWYSSKDTITECINDVLDKFKSN